MFIEKENTFFLEAFIVRGAGEVQDRKEEREPQADGEKSSYVHSYVQDKPNITNPREKTCRRVLPNFLLTGQSGYYIS